MYGCPSEAAGKGRRNRALASRFGFRGQMEEARAIFEKPLAMVGERSDVPSVCTLSLQLGGLEARVGSIPAASRRLDVIDWLLEAPSVAPSYRARLEPLFAAVTGVPEEAERLATQLIESRTARTGWETGHVPRARGMAALFCARPPAGGRRSTTIWEHMEREGSTTQACFRWHLTWSRRWSSCASSTRRGPSQRVLSCCRRRRSIRGGLASVKRSAAVIRFASGYEGSSRVACLQRPSYLSQDPGS